MPRVAVLLMAGAGVLFTASALRPAPKARPPWLRGSGGAGRPAELVADSARPREPVALLFFHGRPTVLVPGGGDRRAVVSETGTLLDSDSTLGLRPVGLALEGRGILGAAPADSGGWWISTVDGQLVRLDRKGAALQASMAPFGATALWPDPVSNGVIASRSPERFSFLPESPASPLVLVLDGQGRIREGRGRLVVPEHSLLATLANAGYAVAVGDTVFFAPLSRAGVVALGPHGDTLWLSASAEGLPTPEPRFKLSGGQVQIDYQPLNLALTLGPDGRLYVLRAADTALARARLDVIERASGRVVWAAELPNVRPTLAANRLGRLYTLDPDRLVGAIPPGSREPLARFQLPRLGGGSLSLDDRAGRVVLINVWASWCRPCRTEMPALDSLQKSLEGPRFALVAISEDPRRRDAERFVGELGLNLTVLFGDGRLQNQLHYPGLPYTLLLDGQGKIIRRWIGQLTKADVELIRFLVHREIAESVGEGQRSHSHQPGRP